jgi:hypothetical protein
MNCFTFVFSWRSTYLFSWVCFQNSPFYAIWFHCLVHTSNLLYNGICRLSGSTLTRKMLPACVGSFHSWYFFISVFATTNHRRREEKRVRKSHYFLPSHVFMQWLDSLFQSSLQLTNILWFFQQCKQSFSNMCHSICENRDPEARQLI